MALQRMRECVCLDHKYYTDITKSAPDSIKESVKSLPEERLSESTVVDDSIKSAIYKLKESNAISDSIVNTVISKLQERGVSFGDRKIYRVPVGRYDNVNGNHRVYTKKLWENVMNNQQNAWKGLCGLADHPSASNDPGSIKNSSIVWLGMDIDTLEKIVYGIGTFVGPLGHMFQEIIDAGGRVGFSSSGFGEIMPDGQTVNPDTYQIERLADVVLNPSQDVYGEIQDEQPANLGNIEYTKQQAVTSNEPEQPMAESTNNSNLKESVNTMETKDNTVKSVLSKVEEKAFRNYVKSFIESANNMKSPIDQMNELHSISEMFEEGVAPDLKEELEEKLEAKKAELQTLLEEAVAMKQELGVEKLSDITEGTKKVIAEGADLAEQVKNYKSLTEGLSTRNKDLQQKVANLEAENKALKETSIGASATRKELTEKIRDLSVKLTAAQASASAVVTKVTETVQDPALVRRLNEALESAKKANTESFVAIEEAKKKEFAYQNALTENKKLKGSLAKAELKLAIRERRQDEIVMSINNNIVHAQESTDSANEKIASLKESINKYKIGNDKLEKANAVLEGKLKEANTMLFNLSSNNKALKESSTANDTFMSNLSASIKAINESGKCEISMNPDGTITICNMTGDTVQNPDETERVDPAIYETTRKDSLSNYMDFREEGGLAIEKYWGDQYSRFGESLLPFEHKIRDAKTLAEAQREFFKALPFISGKIKEARINQKEIRQEKLDEAITNVVKTQTPYQSMAQRFGLI